MIYEVKVLDDKEFENLPFPETETSFGIANPETNTAYVRYNPNKDVMNYLINHEVEHLIEGAGGKHSNHYRNGVYYKGLFDIFGGGEQKSGGIGSTIVRGVQQGAPQVSAPASPNVVQSGASGAPQTGSMGVGVSPSTIERLKGFFSGRNPSEGGF